jgi:hypothetical protein
MPLRAHRVRPVADTAVAAEGRQGAAILHRGLCAAVADGGGAARDAFADTFTALGEAPLRGPVVATYSRHDRATGFWHLRAERRAGVGYAGIGTAPAAVSAIRMRPVDEPYPLTVLDHRFVSVDAGEVFVRGRGPAGAHSDHLRAETAHLLLSLAEHGR